MKNKEGLVFGLVLSAALFLFGWGLSINYFRTSSPVDQQAPMIYQVKLLYPMSVEDMNNWLVGNPGWRVVQISHIDYQTPWILVQKEVIE